jgi:hypothetical protein
MVIKTSRVYSLLETTFIESNIYIFAFILVVNSGMLVDPSAATAVAVTKIST